MKKRNFNLKKSRFLYNYFFLLLNIMALLNKIKKLLKESINIYNEHDDDVFIYIINYRLVMVLNN